MKRAFRGEITQKVDGKGRVSIPAKFCRVLESGDPDWVDGRPAQLVVVHGHPGKTHVEGFTAAAMAEVQARIARKPNGKNRKLLEFVYSARSEEIAVDGSGRIVLPRAVRAKIGLEGDGDVVFVGLGETFQIWRAQDYADTHQAEMEAMLAELGDVEIDELLNDDPGGAT